MNWTQLAGLLGMGSLLLSCGSVRLERQDAPDAGQFDGFQVDSSPDDAGAPHDTGVGECSLGFACPEGATFHREGDVGRCLFEGLMPPPGARSYCQFLDLGYMGYSWPGDETTCPPTARYAPGPTLGFCLWERITPPLGTTADCDEFPTESHLGFRWPCE